MTTCALCGTAGDDPPPLTWVSSRERGRLQHVCERCSRENLRSVEAGLDPVWW